MQLFREARPASQATYAWWTAGQSAVVWALALVVVPFAVTRMEAALGVPGFAFGGQLPAAVVLFLASSALNAWAGASMVRHGQGTPLPTACAPRLVVRGPYAYLRNPMATFGLGQGVAVGLGSWGMLAVVLLVGAGWHGLVRPAEERDLDRRLGADYRAYCAHVRCWLPRLYPYRTDASSGLCE